MVQHRSWDLVREQLSLLTFANRLTLHLHLLTFETSCALALTLF